MPEKSVPVTNQILSLITFLAVKVMYELKLFACPLAFLNMFDRFSQNFEWLLYHHNVVRFTSYGQQIQYGRRANLRGWSSRSL